MKTLRCAIYTRKSSEEGLEQDFNSLHAQREACEAYIRSQVGEGWTPLATLYDDGGISGGTMERPGLKALLCDIVAGRIDVVVVYKVDRLTRSLMDFAKIVEIFDRHKASFVSVTQAFNTTSSMGRLTLNVLLSFAQFEREVTGERIRDKIAASKKKGMWMGGNLPLGYDADGRTLKVNEAEADKVRHIYQRYLELRSAHQLVAELAAQGIRSKYRLAPDGRQIGDAAISRGALFHLLSNRVYLGEITHKDQCFPGLHKPLIDPELFEQVQAVLDENRRRRKGPTPHQMQFPLTGKVFDANGVPMSPTTTQGRHGRRYRYYVSANLQQGDRPMGDGALQRLPAPALEAFAQGCVQRLLGAEMPNSTVLARIDVDRSDVTFTLDCAAILRPGEDALSKLETVSAILGKGERAWVDAGGQIRLCLPLRLSFRGGRRWIDGAEPATRHSDPRGTEQFAASAHAGDQDRHIAAFGIGPRPRRSAVFRHPCTSYSLVGLLSAGPSAVDRRRKLSANPEHESVPRCGVASVLVGPAGAIL